MAKLSKRTIDALSPREKPFIQFDSELAGFGVRVMPSGVMSYVVEYRPHGGGRDVAKRRVTLGKVGALTPDQARKAAADMLAKARLGGDPAEDKAKRREALSVASLCEAFTVEHIETKVKPLTRQAHSIALARLCDAYGSQKAEAITRSKLAALHSEMRDKPFAANRSLAVWGKLFSWAGSRGLIPADHNPARGIERYREQGRERFLTTDELMRLGAALSEGETEGLPWDVDGTKPKAKHLAKPENRRVKLDPFAVAAIRLLILTGARLREILHAQWSQETLSEA